MISRIDPAAMTPPPGRRSRCPARAPPVAPRSTPTTTCRCPTPASAPTRSNRARRLGPGHDAQKAGESPLSSSATAARTTSWAPPSTAAAAVLVNTRSTPATAAQPVARRWARTARSPPVDPNDNYALARGSAWARRPTSTPICRARSWPSPRRRPAATARISSPSAAARRRGRRSRGPTRCPRRRRCSCSTARRASVQHPDRAVDTGASEPPVAGSRCPSCCRRARTRRTSRCSSSFDGEHLQQADGRRRHGELHLPLLVRHKAHIAAVFGTGALLACSHGTPAHPVDTAPVTPPHRETCEVEIGGHARAPKDHPAPTTPLTFVAIGDRLAPDAHMVGTGGTTDGRYFIEVFVPWGSDLTICAAKRARAGQAVDAVRQVEDGDARREVRRGHVRRRRDRVRAGPAARLSPPQARPVIRPRRSCPTFFSTIGRDASLTCRPRL